LALTGVPGRQWKKLNTIRPGDKIINTLFIVLEKRAYVMMCGCGVHASA